MDAQSVQHPQTIAQITWWETITARLGLTAVTVRQIGEDLQIIGI